MHQDSWMGCKESFEWRLLVASMGGHGELQTGYFWFYEDGTSSCACCGFYKAGAKKVLIMVFPKPLPSLLVPWCPASCLLFQLLRFHDPTFSF